MKVSSRCQEQQQIPPRSSRSASPNHMIINGRLMGEHACDNILLHVSKPISSKITDAEKNFVTHKEFSWLEFSSDSSSSDNLSSISQHEQLIGNTDSNSSLKTKTRSQTAHLDGIESYVSYSFGSQSAFTRVKKSLSHGDLMDQAWYSGEPNISNKTSNVNNENLRQFKSMNSQPKKNDDTYLDENLKNKSEFSTLKNFSGPISKQEQFNWFSNTYLRTEISDIDWFERCINSASQCPFDLKLKRSMSHGDLMDGSCDNEELKKTSSMITINRSSCDFSEVLKNAEHKTINTQFINSDKNCIKPKMGANKEEISFTKKEYKDWLKRKNWLKFYHRHISPPSRSSSMGELNNCAKKNLVEFPERSFYESLASLITTKFSTYNTWFGGLAVICITIFFLWLSVKI